MWRSVEELAWVYELATYAAETLPEAVAPLRASDGALALRRASRVISL